jgi:hypothetical protein
MTSKEIFNVSVFLLVFTLFPLWWSATAIVLKAAVNEEKKVPKWMILWMWPNPYNKPPNPYEKPNMDRSNVGPYIKKYRIYAFIWMSIEIGFILYDIILHHSSFSIVLPDFGLALVLLALWLLPQYFLGRYTGKLKPGENHGWEITPPL